MIAAAGVPKRGCTAASLAKLRPAFSADGTVTAGSASQISDGAAAVVVMSRAKAEELGAPLADEVLAEELVGALGVEPGAARLGHVAHQVRTRLVE